jgi:molybdopterin-guanine dinucleotide biosynthesis protein A
MPAEPGEGILGVLLAGGRARRFGGREKCLAPLGNRPLLEIVIAAARPQVRRLLINANGDAARFARFELPVAADIVADFAGPLAGILTAMVWARENVPSCSLVASFAADTPFFPNDLVARLRTARTERGVAVACAGSGGRAHPVFALWPVDLADDLREALQVEGVRKIDAWTARHGVTVVPFDDDDLDPFFNINTERDLAIAEARRAAAATGAGPAS